MTSVETSVQGHEDGPADVDGARGAARAGIADLGSGGRAVGSGDGDHLVAPGVVGLTETETGTRTASLPVSHRDGNDNGVLAICVAAGT